MLVFNEYKFIINVRFGNLKRCQSVHLFEILIQKLKYMVYDCMWFTIHEKQSSSQNCNDDVIYKVHNSKKCSVGQKIDYF